ncbi:hypothetical protein Z517_03864, partial [Fonsecaea pedrosoi CBS 271.37]
VVAFLREHQPSPVATDRLPPQASTQRKIKEGWQEEEEAYHTLIAEGGQPTHPVTFGYDVIDNPDKYEQYSNIL